MIKNTNSIGINNFKGNNTIRNWISIAIDYTDIQMSIIIFKKAVFKGNFR